MNAHIAVVETDRFLAKRLTFVLADWVLCISSTMGKAPVSESLDRPRAGGA